MLYPILIAYAIGALTGFWASKRPALTQRWHHVVRAELLITTVTLSITAAWRITSLSQVLWPALIALILFIMLGLTWLTESEPSRASKASLHAWATTPNTGFFVLPASASLAGPAGAVAGVLLDRLSAVIFASYVHLLRKHAPRTQRTVTFWIDQSPIVAMTLGIALHLVGPAPAWTATLTQWASPLMAMIGASIYVGSLLQPSQRIDPRPGIKRWAVLTATSSLLLVPLIVFAPTPALRLVSILCVLSIPAFGALQMSTVYGYSDSVVAAAARYSWILGAIGLLVGYLGLHH